MASNEAEWETTGDRDRLVSLVSATKTHHSTILNSLKAAVRNSHDCETVSSLRRKLVRQWQRVDLPYNRLTSDVFTETPSQLKIEQQWWKFPYEDHKAALH